MKTYKIGQIVEFKSGVKGEVVEILHKGHHDIRPPYNMEGFPVIQGITFYGQITIIPNEWPKYYGNEEHENLLNIVED